MGAQSNQAFSLSAHHSSARPALAKGGRQVHDSYSFLTSAILSFAGPAHRLTKSLGGFWPRRLASELCNRSGRRDRKRALVSLFASDWNRMHEQTRAIPICSYVTYRKLFTLTQLNVSLSRESSVSMSLCCVIFIRFTLNLFTVFQKLHQTLKSVPFCQM